MKSMVIVGWVFVFIPESDAVDFHFMNNHKMFLSVGAKGYTEANPWSS